VTPSGKGNAYSSAFVGIDGVTSPTVEQIGTESDVVNGKPQYSVWYETYPQASVTVAPMKVQPGDTINAAVRYMTSGSHAGQFQLTLTDASQKNDSFTTYQSAPMAQRSSAEWIVETPSTSSGILPTANVSSVTFTNASATINGKTGPIDAPSWQTTAIQAQSAAGLAAMPTALTDSGAVLKGVSTRQAATGTSVPFAAASQTNSSSSFTVVPSIVTGNNIAVAPAGSPSHLLHAADEMIGDASYGGYGYGYGGGYGDGDYTISGSGGYSDYGYGSQDNYGSSLNTYDPANWLGSNLSPPYWSGNYTSSYSTGVGSSSGLPFQFGVSSPFGSGSYDLNSNAWNLVNNGTLMGWGSDGSVFGGSYNGFDVNWTPSTGTFGFQSPCVPVYGLAGVTGGANFSPYSTTVSAGLCFGTPNFNLSVQMPYTFNYGYGNLSNSLSNSLYNQLPYTDSFYQQYTHDPADPYWMY
jgi:hypothetical protein